MEKLTWLVLFLLFWRKGWNGEAFTGRPADVVKRCATTIRLRSDGISMKCHPWVERAVTFPFQRVKELKLQTVVSEYQRHLCVIRSFVCQNKNQSQKKKNVHLVFSSQFPILCLIGKWAIAILDTLIWALWPRSLHATDGSSHIFRSQCRPLIFSEEHKCVFFFFYLDGFCQLSNA